MSTTTAEPITDAEPPELDGEEWRGVVGGLGLCAVAVSADGNVDARRWADGRWKPEALCLDSILLAWALALRAEANSEWWQLWLARSAGLSVRAGCIIQSHQVGDEPEHETPCSREMSVALAQAVLTHEPSVPPGDAEASYTDLLKRMTAGEGSVQDRCDEAYGAIVCSRAQVATLREAVAEAVREQEGQRARVELLERKAEAVRAGWLELRDRERDLHRKLAMVNAGAENVWRWQGDGNDKPESLSCPVVMSADTLRALLARTAPKPELDWADVNDAWSDSIKAAHPTRSGSHYEYAVAMEMVGHRHSKGALVDLVNWLLVRAHPLMNCEARDDNA